MLTAMPLVGRSPVLTKLALALTAAALGLTGCGGSSSGGSPSAASLAAPTVSDTSSPAGTTGGGTALAIASFQYDPSPLTVAPGASVAVSNRDSAGHTATSDTSGLFKSGNVAKGQTVTFTAPTKPGTYQFHCDYHANMHGTLIVK
jgi:plastocyanin